jgi:hypothetical protein
MAITFADVHSAVEGYPNIRTAFDRATRAWIEFFIEKQRYAAKPGFFARIRLDRRFHAAAHFAGNFACYYQDCTGSKCNDADLMDITTIIADRAKGILNPQEADRKLFHDMCEKFGISVDEGADPRLE